MAAAEAGGGGGGSNLAAGTGTSCGPAWLPTKSDFPSGANVTHQALDFSFSGPSCSPFAETSQSLMAPSRLVLASRVPSAEKARLVTQSLWLASVASEVLSAVFQSRTVRSAPQLASVPPSGE